MINKIILQTALILIALNTTAQTFEGKITYANDYQSKLANLKSEQLNAMMGTKQDYYFKGSSYKSVFNGAFTKMQVYKAAENKSYTLTGKNDTLYWEDYSTNKDEAVKYELQKNKEIILGIACDVLIVEANKSKTYFYFTAQSEIVKAKDNPDFVPLGVKLESTAKINAKIVNGKFTQASATVTPKEFESPVLGGIKPAFTEVRNYSESISKDGLTATIHYDVQTQLAGVEVFGQFLFGLLDDGTVQTNIITVTQSVDIVLKVGSISTTFDGSTFPESRYNATYIVDTETKKLKGTVSATLQQSSYYKAVKAATFREKNHPQKTKKTLTY